MLYNFFIKLVKICFFWEHLCIYDQIIFLQLKDINNEKKSIEAFVLEFNDK